MKIKANSNCYFLKGLKVIGSTSDQLGTNMSAIHTLMKKSSKTPDGGLLSYRIRDNTIYHCFDPPHLIKVLRNNLQTKNLKHFVTKRWQKSNNINIRKKQFASWDHISALYNLDSKSSRRLVPRLTEEHINPSKLKMKVSVATQVFSVACRKAMILLAEQKELPKHVSGTAQMLIFFLTIFLIA